MRTHHSKPRNHQTIPPPPTTRNGYDAIIEYFQKYSTDELERAGYLKDVPERYIRELEISAACQYVCEHGLRLKLARKDCERLARLAAKQEVRVETLVRNWVKERLQRE